MAVVDDGGTPPPELTLAWQCQRWNCLPSELYEQDYATMMGMTTADNVYSAVSALRGAKGKAIHGVMSGGTGRILAALKREGLI